MGGTQRMTRLIGKSKSMEMHLTGRMMDAVEAERAGLVARIIPMADLVAESIKTATLIAGKSLLALRAAKESVNRALEVPLAEGLLFERRAFHAAFATDDQTEGMQAFLEKRTANFTDK
jgi:enoyl-CoA hydratase/carnithine racemase